MKKIRIIYAFFLLIMVGSCDSFLDVEPKNVIDPDRFYNTEADGVAALAGIYQHLMSPECLGRDMERFFNFNHDLTSPTRLLGAGRTDVAFSWDQNNEMIREIWRTLYRAINDANVLIFRMTNSSLPEGVKKEIIAEGIFLRSLIYYHMVVMFKDVPFIVEPTINAESFFKNSTMARTPSDKILNSLIEDLTKVENDLPAKIRSDYKARATRWALKSLKLKIYSWQKNHAGVISTALDIINNSPHKLLNNYADIFKSDNEFNDEMIFQLDYVTNQISTNRHTTYAPRPQDERVGPLPLWFDGAGGYTIYKSVVESFDPNDLRRNVNIMDALDNGVKLNFAYVRKMLRPNDPRGNGGLNLHLIRLADIYLELSEAENELNGSTTLALNSINVIRKRAGLSSLSGLNKDELRQAIRNERVWELLGEGIIRNIDLKRWGILRQAIEQRKILEQATPSTKPALIAILNQKLNNLTPGKEWLPIPLQEIILNKNLTQNEGYF